MQANLDLSASNKGIQSSLTINANNVFKLTVDNLVKSTGTNTGLLGAPQSSQDIGSVALSLNGQSYNYTWSFESSIEGENYDYQRKISVNLPSQGADIEWSRNIIAGKSAKTSVNAQLRSDEAKFLELNIDHLSNQSVTNVHVHLVAKIPEKVFLYFKILSNYSALLF